MAMVSPFNILNARTDEHEQRTEAWLKNLNALKEGLSRIQKKDSSDLSFEQLYRMTVDIVREKKFHMLYDATLELVIDHMQTIRNDIHPKLIENKFDCLINQWQEHIVCSRMFRDVLMYLNQTCVKYNLECIYNASMNAFRNEVLQHDSVRECIQKNLLEMIHNERKGQAIDHITFKAIINMLLTISKLDGGNNLEYKQLFEDEFLQQTTVFYSQEAQSLLSSPDTDAILYIENYKQRQKEEKQRVEKLLHESTKTPLMIILDDCLIKEHLSDIINMKGGLLNMLETSSLKELIMIHEWYKKYSKENELIDIVSQTFHEFGLSLVERKNILNADQSKVVKNVLELKQKYTEYQKQCFQNNEKLRENIESDFEIIFNRNSNMPEYFSAYIHDTMRKDSHTLQEDELDKKFHSFMQLFRILYDKDIFERHYKKHLAKRLLTNPNLDNERKIISKFKTECGHSFTTNLEDMLTDIEVSAEHMKLLRDEQSFDGIEFNMTVVKSGAWSIPQIPSCYLPPLPKILFEIYTAFYDDKHSGRKLTLLSNCGSATLEASYKKSENNPKLNQRSVKLDVSTIQMMVLLLFNEEECLTIEEIHFRTNIPEQNLITSLNPIVLGKSKYRILRRVIESNGKVPLSKESVIAVNDEYFTKDKRVKLPFHATHRSMEDTSEREEILERTNVERRFEIDAAIVRIMKSRNVLTHRDLVSEVIQQLKARFKPDVKMINNRIKHLLDEKDYIKQKDNDPSTYLYNS